MPCSAKKVLELQSRDYQKINTLYVETLIWSLNYVSISPLEAALCTFGADSVLYSVFNYVRNKDVQINWLSSFNALEQQKD